MKPTKLCLLFNETLGFIYYLHHHRLYCWNFSYTYIQPLNFQRYENAFARNLAPLNNCFGFVNGTAERICRPVLNESVGCNGHVRVHGVEFQIVVLVNDLIISFEGQWESRRHDCVL